MWAGDLALCSTICWQELWPAFAHTSSSGAYIKVVLSVATFESKREVFYFSVDTTSYRLTFEPIKAKIMG